MQSTILNRQYDVFQKQLPVLLEKHYGKYAVISDNKIKGIYDTEIAAYSEAVSKYGLGNFLVQPVIKEEEAEIIYFGHNVQPVFA